jgi:hypothetical protein
MKKYTLILLAIIAVSCKTKAIVATKSKVTEKTETEKIIEGHYYNKTAFSSLYIKANVKYKDAKQSQSVTAEIRIKKDEIIMVSIRFLGITMAKALITPDKVRYYEKINGKFFEGNYAALTEFLGTDLDFQKLQNLFIGKAFDDLRNEKYGNTLEDKMYKLESLSDGNTKKAFFFNEKFQIKKEIISQTQQNRILEVNYPNFKEYPEGVLPNNILIDATQEKGNTTISFDYNNISFNEELNFPYNVPEGYEQIFIK